MGELSLMMIVVVLISVSWATAAEVKQMTLVNMAVGATKIWLPSTIVLYEGDEIELTLVNKHKTKHGFKIVQFDIETEVLFGKKQVVKFKADKAGTFPFVCQLHGPHIGGQVVVLKP